MKTYFTNKETNRGPSLPEIAEAVPTKRTHDLIVTSLLHQNNVEMSCGVVLA